MRAINLFGAAALLVAPPVLAQEQVPSATLAPHWVRGADIEMMVTKEVNSRTSKAGDRFKLRVNAPVVVDGKIAIPVGATAWAEVIAVSGTGAAGGAGHLSMHLLYAETPWGRVALTGTRGAEGVSNTGGVVLGVLGFGILGLLTKGNNAVFKAGDIIHGYIADGEEPVAPPLVVNK